VNINFYSYRYNFVQHQIRNTDRRDWMRRYRAHGFWYKLAAPHPGWIAYCVSIMPPARHIWFRFAVAPVVGRRWTVRRGWWTNLLRIGTYARTRVCHVHTFFIPRYLRSAEIRGNCKFLHAFLHAKENTVWTEICNDLGWYIYAARW